MPKAQDRTQWNEQPMVADDNDDFKVPEELSIMLTQKRKFST